MHALPGNSEIGMFFGKKVFSNSNELEKSDITEEKTATPSIASDVSEISALTHRESTHIFLMYNYSYYLRLVHS